MDTRQAFEVIIGYIGFVDGVFGRFSAVEKEGVFHQRIPVLSYRIIDTF
jgi:hypothetical protein